MFFYLIYQDLKDSFYTILTKKDIKLKSGVTVCDGKLWILDSRTLAFGRKRFQLTMENRLFNHSPLFYFILFIYVVLLVYVFILELYN